MGNRSNMRGWSVHKTNTNREREKNLRRNFEFSAIVRLRLESFILRMPLPTSHPPCVDFPLTSFRKVNLSDVKKFRIKVTLDLFFRFSASRVRNFWVCICSGRKIHFREISQYVWGFQDGEGVWRTKDIRKYSSSINSTCSRVVDVGNEFWTRRVIFQNIR